jgi:hypothetical protein
MSQAVHDHDDSPEVGALRKVIRGETLTADERALLARLSRKPTGGTEPLTEEQIEALLSERVRAGG